MCSVASKAAPEQIWFTPSDLNVEIVLWMDFFIIIENPDALTFWLQCEFLILLLISISSIYFF